MPTKKVTKKRKAPTRAASKARVLVEFIQDRSGSMQTVWDEALKGFTGFLDDLRKNKDVDYFISLTVFDTVVDRVLSGVPLKQVTGQELVPHSPRGMTALYDALGDALQMPTDDFTKVIYLIVTDGHNNASSRFTKTQVHDAITAKLNTGNCTFQYLGTQPESWEESKGMGFNASSTATFVPQNIGGTYRMTGQSVNSFSSSRLTNTRSLYSNFGDEAQIGSLGMTVGEEEDDDPADKK